MPTLVMVHRKSLLNQWCQGFQESYGLGKAEIGVIGDGKNRVGQRITVAMIQSLSGRDSSDLVYQVGQIVVDECHNVAAPTVAAVLRQFPARYLLGLTATPRREDGLSRLITCYLGDLVKGPTTVELHQEGEIVLPTLRVRETTFQSLAAAPQDRTADRLRDDSRNDMIANDVVRAVEEGHLCLLLCVRQEHCDRLSELLEGRVGTAILYGQPGKKKQAQVWAALAEGRARVLVSTYSLWGKAGISRVCPRFSWRLPSAAHRSWSRCWAG